MGKEEGDKRLLSGGSTLFTHDVVWSLSHYMNRIKAKSRASLISFKKKHFSSLAQGLPLDIMASPSRSCTSLVLGIT